MSENDIDISARHFDQKAYVAQLYGDTTFDQLTRQVIPELVGEADRMEDDLRQLVQDNLDVFVACKDTIDGIYDSDRNLFNGKAMDGLLDHFQQRKNKCMDVLDPMFQRHDHIARLRKSKELVDHLRDVLCAPSQMRQYTKAQEYEAAVLSYKRARLALLGGQHKFLQQLRTEVDNGAQIVVQAITRELSSVQPNDTASIERWVNLLKELKVPEAPLLTYIRHYERHRVADLRAVVVKCVRAASAATTVADASVAAADEGEDAQLFRASTSAWELLHTTTSTSDLADAVSGLSTLLHKTIVEYWAGTGHAVHEGTDDALAEASQHMILAVVAEAERLITASMNRLAKVGAEPHSDIAAVLPRVHEAAFSITHAISRNHPAAANLTGLWDTQLTIFIDALADWGKGAICDTVLQESDPGEVIARVSRSHLCTTLPVKAELILQRILTQCGPYLQSSVSPMHVDHLGEVLVDVALCFVDSARHAAFTSDNSAKTINCIADALCVSEVVVISVAQGLPSPDVLEAHADLMKEVTTAAVDDMLTRFVDHHRSALSALAGPKAFRVGRVDWQHALEPVQLHGYLSEMLHHAAAAHHQVVSIQHPAVVKDSMRRVFDHIGAIFFHYVRHELDMWQCSERYAHNTLLMLAGEAQFLQETLTAVGAKYGAALVEETLEYLVAAQQGAPAAASGKRETGDAVKKRNDLCSALQTRTRGLMTAVTSVHTVALPKTKSSVHRGLLRGGKDPLADEEDAFVAEEAAPAPDEAPAGKAGRKGKGLSFFKRKKGTDTKEADDPMADPMAAAGAAAATSSPPPEAEPKEEKKSLGRRLFGRSAKAKAPAAAATATPPPEGEHTDAAKSDNEAPKPKPARKGLFSRRRESDADAKTAAAEANSAAASGDETAAKPARRTMFGRKKAPEPAAKPKASSDGEASEASEKAPPVKPSKSGGLFGRKSAARTAGSDDEEEEDAKPKKSGGLFGRRKPAKAAGSDDEEEEEAKPKKSGGLFGRRKPSASKAAGSEEDEVDPPPKASRFGRKAPAPRDADSDEEAAKPKKGLFGRRKPKPTASDEESDAAPKPIGRFGRARRKATEEPSDGEGSEDHHGENKRSGWKSSFKKAFQGPR